MTTTTYSHGGVVETVGLVSTYVNEPLFTPMHFDCEHTIVVPVAYKLPQG